jgi:DNA-binding response OmpR family regulator
MNALGTSSLAKTPPPFSILLVDDNRDFIEFLKYLLSHRGFDVQCVYGGTECLDAVRRQNFDLVILDVMMPKMDGLTVCRELKKFAPSLPVFLLTAKDDLSTRAAAIELGASEFLAKPVNIEDFITRVRTQCHISQWDKSLDDALAAKA